MLISIETVYTNLEMLDRVDVITSASYRQLAQEIIASTEIDIAVRQEIADKLNLANQLLVKKTVGSEDSY